MALGGSGWLGGGGSLERLHMLEAASGFDFIRLTQGLAALETAVCMHDGPAVLGVIPVVWSRLFRAGVPVPAFLSAFASAQTASPVELDQDEEEPDGDAGTANPNPLEL